MSARRPTAADGVAGPRRPGPPVARAIELDVSLTGRARSGHRRARAQRRRQDDDRARPRRGAPPRRGPRPRRAASVWDDGRGAGSRPSSAAVGLMLADSLLFPHLRAVDNVAYGPRSRGVDRRRARDRARTELERVGLADRAASQAARALVGPAGPRRPGPRPRHRPARCSCSTSRSPPSTRTPAHGTRSDLAARLAAYDGVTVLVTHDPLDALTLADHLVFIEDGRVTQTGTPAEVLSEPRSAYVGTVVGLNLYAAQGDSHGHVHTARRRAHRHDEPDRGAGVGHDPAERRVAAPARRRRVRRATRGGCASPR